MILNDAILHGGGIGGRAPPSIPEATREVKNDWQLFLSLGTKQSWQSTLYSIVDSARLVAAFRPSDVSAHALSHPGATKLFWQLPAKGHRSRVVLESWGGPNSSDEDDEHDKIDSSDPDWEMPEDDSDADSAQDDGEVLSESAPTTPRGNDMIFLPAKA